MKCKYVCIIKSMKLAKVPYKGGRQGTVEWNIKLCLCLFVMSQDSGERSVITQYRGMGKDFWGPNSSYCERQENDGYKWLPNLAVG